jgi:hypothetical protein
MRDDEEEEEEEERMSADYKSRLVQAVSALMRVLVRCWRHELTGAWLVRHRLVC